MIGNYRLAGAQGIACRRGQIGPDGSMTVDSLIPADAGANKQAVLCRKILHNFTIFCAQTFGCDPGGVIEHFNEARALKGKDAKFGKQLLLTNAQTECATGEIIGLIFVRTALNNRLFVIR